MKKMILAMLLLVFSGVSFAEIPQIVNPPRPTKKFKWLIVVMHISPGPVHNHFIYTDKYDFKKRTAAGWFDNDTSEYFAIGDETIVSGQSDGQHIRDDFGEPLLENLTPPWTITVHCEAMDIQSGAFFLVAKAPKPLTILEQQIFGIKIYPSRQPQKAKVVFTK